VRDTALCVATAAVALLSAACGHDPAAGSASAPSAATASTPAKVPAIGPVGLAEALAASPGTRLTVAADFAGWSGGCTGGPPRTRADWMLVDGEGRCLYVSGPLPGGVTPPPDARSNGTRVTVPVQRLATDDGRPYLQRTP
jgi:hypothetical protein